MGHKLHPLIGMVIITRCVCVCFIILIQMEQVKSVNMHTCSLFMVLESFTLVSQIFLKKLQ